MRQTLRSAAGAVALAGAALVALTGCSSFYRSPGTDVRQSPGAPVASTAEAPKTTAPARVSMPTLCPDLVEHTSTGSELVSLFVSDSRALADGGAPTVARFDTVIEDLRYDATVSPPPLVPFVEAQLTTLQEVRDLVVAGGAGTVELRAYRSAALEVANQCAAYL